MLKRKIGIVLQKTIITYDVISFLNALDKYYEIKVVVKANEAEYFKTRLGKIKIAPYRIKGSILNKFFKSVFNYFGFLPKSINNYKIVSYFIHYRIQSKLKRIITKLKFQIELSCPKFYTYDMYLNSLKCDVEVENFSDILFFTHISDDELLSFFKKTHKRIYVYLYSWDHSCKLKRLPKSVHYFVWNELIKQDLILLNNLNKSIISIVGSTQLALVNEYLKNKAKMAFQKKKDKYILFAFSTAYDKLIEDEINFVKYLDEVLKKAGYKIRLVLRAYPINEKANVYDNIINDNISFIDTTGMKLTTLESISKKYDQIYEAAAFFHFGTTLGLEASFFDTPVFLVDFYDFAKNLAHALSIKKFVHQYQNNKYLNVAQSPNVIRNKEQLAEVLKNINDGNIESFKPYSLKIREQFHLKSIEEIASQVYSVIQ